MKHFNFILLIAIITLFANTKLQAQDIWLDVDFSTNDWILALEEAGFMNPVDGVVDITADYATYPFKPGIYGDIEGEQGFYLNGHWSGKWVLEPATGVDGRTITHSIRLRRNNLSYIQLPKLANAGKVSVYVMNSNETSSTDFDIEKLEDDNVTWTNLTTLTTLGSSNYPDGAAEDKQEFEVNSSKPITLRVYKNSARFMNVFRIVVEKYSPSSIKSTFSNLTNVRIQGKNLHIDSDKDAMNSIQFIDLSGRLVWQSQTAEKQVQLPTSIQQGMYIVRLSNKHGTLNQSVLIN